MTMLLALTPVLLLLDAFDVIVYVTKDDANANAKMPKAARHPIGAYDISMMSPLLPMLMLLRRLLRANTCDVVMLKCVCIRVSLWLSTARMCVVFVHVPLLVRACICFAGATTL